LKTRAELASEKLTIEQEKGGGKKSAKGRSRSGSPKKGAGSKSPDKKKSGTTYSFHRKLKRLI